MPIRFVGVVPLQMPGIDDATNTKLRLQNEYNRHCNAAAIGRQLVEVVGMCL